MPKRPEGRQISERGERNLAQRIQRMRQDRGWSFETLARHMTEAGCPITKGSLFQIEQSEKPRRITVDELVAFADVFAGGDVAELLIPMDAIERREAHEVIRGIDENNRTLKRALGDAMEAYARLVMMRQNHPELAEYVNNHLGQLAEADPGDAIFFLQDVGQYPDDVQDVAWLMELYLQSAFRALWRQVAASAYEWVDFMSGNWSADRLAAVKGQIAEECAALGWTTDRPED